MPACASRLRARSFASTWPGRAEIRRACYAIPTRLRLLTAEQFMLSARTTVVDNQTQQTLGTYFSTLCKLYNSIQILILVPMSLPIS
jgi:hypothetical protein